MNGLGFTAGGVSSGKCLLIYTSWLTDILSGSVTALVQSTIYRGQTAGLFSVFQGIGATAAISLPSVIRAGSTLTVAGARLQVIKSPWQKNVNFSIEFLMHGIEVNVLYIL